MKKKICFQSSLPSVSAFHLRPNFFRLSLLCLSSSFVRVGLTRSRVSWMQPFLNTERLCSSTGIKTKMRNSYEAKVKVGKIKRSVWKTFVRSFGLTAKREWRRTRRRRRQVGPPREVFGLGLTGLSSDPKAPPQKKAFCQSKREGVCVERRGLGKKEWGLLETCYLLCTVTELPENSFLCALFFWSVRNYFSRLDVRLQLAGHPVRITRVRLKHAPHFYFFLSRFHFCMTMIFI
jgi:hypothetical protein